MGYKSSYSASLATKSISTPRKDLSPVRSALLPAASTPGSLASPISKISRPIKRVKGIINRDEMANSRIENRAAVSGSRASSILSDSPYSDSGTPEPTLSAKRPRNGNGSGGRCNKKLKVPSPTDEDVKVGVHIKWHDVPIFVSLKRDGRLCYRAYKNESPDWTEQEWTDTFRSKIPLIHTEDVVFGPEVCKGYKEGNLQTAQVGVKCKIVKKYLVAKTEEIPVAAPVIDTINKAEIAGDIRVRAQISLDAPILDAKGDLRVGTHIRHEVPVYAYLKRNSGSDFVYFRIHAREILPLELPSPRVQAGEIKFDENYDLGSIEATKAQIFALLNQPRLSSIASETRKAVGAMTQTPHSPVLIGSSEDDSLSEATKAAESAFGKLQAALARRQQSIDYRENKITSDKARFTADESDLKKRERDFKMREDAFEAEKKQFQKQKKNLKEAQLKLKHDENLLKEKPKAVLLEGATPTAEGSLRKWEPKLKLRELDVRHQEEHWVKEKEALFKAREQELDADKADLQRREDEFQERQKRQEQAAGDRSALVPGDSLAATSLNSPNACQKKPMTLEIPQYLAFDDIFKEITSDKPNGGMLWEKEHRPVTMTSEPFRGTSFTESRMLSEVSPIAVIGTLKPGKVIEGGESFSVYEKDRIRKLVQDLDRGSLVEYQGKYYVCRKLLKEIVVDEAF